MKKLIPFHYYDFIKITKWMNEQSQRGYHTVKWGNTFVTLEDATDQLYQYQIDIDGSKVQPYENRKEKLKQQGWEYISTISKDYLHIYRTKQLDSEFERNQEAINQFRKKLMKEIVFSCIYILLLLILAGFILFHDTNYRFLNAMEESEFLFILGPLILVYSMIGLGFNVRKWWKLYKLLKQPLSTKVIQVKNRDGSGKFFVPFTFFTIIYVSILVVLYGIGIVSERRYQNFYPEEAMLPCIDLSLIEEREFEITQIDWDEFQYRNVNFGNKILEEWGIFSKKHCEVSQYGTNAAGEQIQSDADYWEMRTEKSAEYLFEQSYERYTTFQRFENKKNEKIDAESYWKISQPKDERFDRLMILEGISEYQGTFLLIARVDCYVIQYFYWGDILPEHLVDELGNLYSF